MHRLTQKSEEQCLLHYVLLLSLVRSFPIPLFSFCCWDLDTDKIMEIEDMEREEEQLMSAWFEKYSLHNAQFAVRYFCTNEKLSLWTPITWWTHSFFLTLIRTLCSPVTINWVSFFESFWTRSKYYHLVVYVLCYVTVNRQTQTRVLFIKMWTKIRRCDQSHHELKLHVCMVTSWRRHPGICK